MFSQKTHVGNRPKTCLFESNFVISTCSCNSRNVLCEEQTTKKGVSHHRSQLLSFKLPSSLVNLSMKKNPITATLFYPCPKYSSHGLSPSFSLINEVVSINSSRFHPANSEVSLCACTCWGWGGGVSQSSDLNPPRA